jgi:hypothetical protein
MPLPAGDVLGDALVGAVEDGAAAGEAGAVDAAGEE